MRLRPPSTVRQSSTMVTAAAPQPPSTDRKVWLATLRETIKRGEYRVDPHAVANAALRHDEFRRQLLG